MTESKKRTVVTTAEENTAWAAERARLMALLPMRCDEVVAASAAAMQAAERSGDSHCWVGAAVLFARAHSMRGDTELALRSLHQWLSQPEADFAPVDRAHLLRELGVTLETLGRLVEALDVYHEALAVFTEADDLWGIAAVQLSMGVVHSRCSDYLIGYNHFNAALATFEMIDEANGIVRVLNNIGLNRRFLRLFDESLTSYDRAISVALASGLEAFVPTLVGGRGQTLLAMGRLDEAAECFAEQARADAAGDWTRSKLEVRLSLATLAHARGECDAAIRMLKALVPDFYAIGALDEEVQALGLLAEWSEAAGLVADALEAYKHLRERERVWLDQRADTRMRASALHTDLDAAREAVRAAQRRRSQMSGAATAVAMEVAHRQARLEALRREAREDVLTGLPNRRDFFERLAEECRRARLFGQPLAVAMIDVDDFKAINDSHGHAAGDKVLIELGRRLRAALRPGDLVARIGGEEFAVLLPNAGADDALDYCEALRRSVSEEALPIGATHQRVTVSIGVTHYKSGEDSDTLLTRADRSLYWAKSSGRNQVCDDHSFSVDGGQQIAHIREASGAQVSIVQ